MKYIIDNCKKQDNAILIYFSDMEGDQNYDEFNVLYKIVKKIVRKDYWIEINEGKIRKIKNCP